MFGKYKTNTIIAIIAIAIISYNLFINTESDRKDKIAKLTNTWVNAVTVKNNPVAVADLFCINASLFGSASKTYRTKDEIGQYFNFFAKIPGIRILDHKYNIQKVSDDVYINSVIAKIIWNDLDKPNTVRLSFVYKDNCIIHLHGSGLPEMNIDLKNTDFLN